MIYQAVAPLGDQEDQMIPFFFFVMGVPTLILLAGFLLAAAFSQKEGVGQDKFFLLTPSAAGPLLASVAGMFLYMFFALGPLLEWSGVN